MREKSTQLDINVKKYWWSRAQRSIKCFTFNQKKSKNFYLFIYSAAMTLLFAVRRFPVAFLLLLSQAFEASAGMKILIYFSCSTRFPIDGRPIIHVIWVLAMHNEGKRVTHNSFLYTLEWRSGGLGKKESLWEKTFAGIDKRFEIKTFRELD